MPSNFSAFYTKYHKTEKKMDETKHGERQNSSYFLFVVFLCITTHNIPYLLREVYPEEAFHFHWR